MSLLEVETNGSVIICWNEKLYLYAGQLQKCFHILENLFL